MLPSNLSVANAPEYIPRPTPQVEATVTPSAKKSISYVNGEVKGMRLRYADLFAFAWWTGGGWLTLNRGKKGLRRVHRGNEDVTQVRR